VPHEADRSFLDPRALARLNRLSLMSRFPMIGTVSGLHRSAHHGSSIEFAEYRKYAPGDDTRHVDWRVYARSDRFFMKEFESDTNLRAYLVIDASGSMAFEAAHGSRFHYARRMVATLAYLLAHQGDAVGLTACSASGRRSIPPRDTPSHLRNLFDTLAEIEPTGPTDLVAALHDMAESVRNRALALIFSDCFTEVPPLLDALQHLRFKKHDAVVFHLLDRQELAFAFDRPIRFLDLESPFDLISDPSTIQSAYRRELDSYLDQMQTGCLELNVDYHRIVTDTDYEQALSTFLIQRIRRHGAHGKS
jgi:uncharacterized protein (DUF58 family)